VVIDVVFLGTPQFAVPSLQSLLNSSEFSVKGVFTQPDRRAGRGRKFCCPPVKLLASEYGVEVFQPERIRGNREASGIMEALQPDLAVVVAYGQILPEDFYTIPRLDTVNVHASLLPSYRGASPIVGAILNGEAVTGVSIMKIDRGMDTGDVLSMREVPLPRDATAGLMETVLAETGARLLVDTVPGYARGEIIPVPQDHAAATYAPKLSKSDEMIDWNRPAERIHNQIRAMNPRPGAMTCFRKRSAELKVWKSLAEERCLPRSAAPGTIVSIDEAGLAVACGDSNTLTVQEVQLCGRTRITAADFVNGCGAVVGDILG